MVNKLKTSLLLLTVFFTNKAFAQSNILTLQECIEIGVKNNLSLKGQGEDIRKAQLEQSKSRAKLLPVINGFGNFMNNVVVGTSVSDGSGMGAMLGIEMPYMVSKGLRYNTSAGAQIAMPLYNQTLYSSISIAKKMKELKQFSYEKAKEDITVEISKIYFLAQTMVEQVKLIDENIKRLSALVEITNAFYDNGMAMDVDLKRVNINLENQAIQKANSEAMYQQQLNLLKFMLDLPMEAEFSLTPVSIDYVNTPKLIGVSRNLNEFKMLYFQRDIIDKQNRAINQEYIPTLSLVGQLGYTNYTDHFENYFHSNKSNSLNKWHNSFYWGVSLRVPIFDGFDKRLNRKKVDIDYIKVQYQIKDTEQKMETQYKNAMNDWTNNYRNFNKQKENLSLTQDVYSVTASRYKEGIVSMTELLQDEMRLTEAQHNFTNASYNCRVTELSLLKLTGKLDQLSNK